MSASHPAHTGKPDQFTFYFGSFSSRSLYLKLENNSLLVEQTEGGNFSSSSFTITPKPADWDSFHDELSTLHVFDWSPEYQDPKGCCMAAYWTLSLRWGGQSLTSRGSFASTSPDNPAALSHRFLRFLESVERLISSS